MISFREILLKKAKMKAKKKPRRRSDSSGGYTLSDIIQSPPAAGRLLHTEDLLFLHMTPSNICISISMVVFGKKKKVMMWLTDSLPLSDLSIPGEVGEGELHRVSAGTAHIWLRRELHGGWQSPRHAITCLPRQSWGQWAATSTIIGFITDGVAL